MKASVNSYNLQVDCRQTCTAFRIHLAVKADRIQEQLGILPLLFNRSRAAHLAEDRQAHLKGTSVESKMGGKDAICRRPQHRHLTGLEFGGACLATRNLWV